METHSKFSQHEHTLIRLWIKPQSPASVIQRGAQGERLLCVFMSDRVCLAREHLINISDVFNFSFICNKTWRISLLTTSELNNQPCQLTWAKSDYTSSYVCVYPIPRAGLITLGCGSILLNSPSSGSSYKCPTDHLLHVWSVSSDSDDELQINIYSKL